MANKKSLRKIIEEASEKLDVLKNPDVSEAKKLLDEILVVAGIGSINHDYLKNIKIYYGMVCLETGYYIRGCFGSNDYEFPEEIIDAKDPIKAATLWGLEKHLSNARYEVDSKKRALEHSEKELKKAEDKLNSFLSSSI